MLRPVMRVLSVPCMTLDLVAALVFSPLAAGGSGGCSGGRRITRAECTEMLDRYIDMTVAGEPLANGGDDVDPNGASARAAREMKKSQRKGNASYARVREQCEAEITQREHRCAMKAPTPETWQACID